MMRALGKFRPVIFLAAAVILIAAAGDRPGPRGLVYDFLPAIGSPRALAILVSTSDRPPTRTSEELGRSLFGREDDGVVSVAEYYDQASYGRLCLQGEVTPWIALDKTMDYYAGGSQGLDDKAYPRNLAGLVADAVAGAKAMGVDFSRFDNTGDGHLDGIVVIYSGPLQEGEVRDRVWAREDYITMLGGPGLEADGKRLDRFISAPEYLNQREPENNYVIIHEMGHLLGLHDLYDKDRSSGGVGSLALMGTPRVEGGKVIVTGMSPFSKSLLGWVEPRIAAGPESITLRPISEFPDALRVDTANPAEYFLISYHASYQDAPAGPGGVLVWHVNENAVYENHYECKGPCASGPLVKVIQADGRDDLARGENLFDPADFFPGPSGLVTRFGADTGNADNPFSGAVALTFAGLPAGFSLQNIRVDGERAVFDLMIPDSAVPCRNQPCFRVLETSWRETKGDGDGFAEPGEELFLDVVIANLGPPVRRVEVFPSSVILDFKKSRLSLGDMGSGEIKTLAFPVEVIDPNAVSGAERVVKGAFTDVPPPTETGTLPESAPVGLLIKPLSPAVTQRFRLKPPLGEPSILLVNDAPHDLLPLLESAASSLKLSIYGWDVRKRGLPPVESLRAADMVVWLSGARLLDQGYPDRRRMALFQAMEEGQGTLVLSVCGGAAPRELLDLFGLAAAGQAGGLKSLTGIEGAHKLRLALGYPYYPSLTPHFALEKKGASDFLFDSGGRTAASILKTPGGGRMVFLGFPLEGLNHSSVQALLKILMTNI